jgi:hypothetical protein
MNTTPSGWVPWPEAGALDSAAAVPTEASPMWRQDLPQPARAALPWVRRQPQGIKSLSNRNLLLSLCGSSAASQGHPWLSASCLAARQDPECTAGLFSGDLRMEAVHLRWPSTYQTSRVLTESRGE